MINEVKRFQKLAGINEIRVNNPTNLLIFIELNIDKILDKILGEHNSRGLEGWDEIEEEGEFVRVGEDDAYYFSESLPSEEISQNYFGRGLDSWDKIDINNKTLYYVGV